MSNKICSKCGIEKSISQFRVHKNCVGGFNTICKICTDHQSEVHRLKNRELRKQQDRARNLKHKFGLTVQQYNELLEKQNHSCAVCLRHEDDFKIRLAVDHNHKTGEIRGLLCTHCNHRLVGRNTDGALLRRVADYVEQGTGWFIREKKKKPYKRKRII